MSHAKNQPGPPHFRVGDKVRVQYGVIVPDFPEIPLGGWTGTVTEVEQTDDQITYEIEWDQRTLRGMHPVYRKRCERDGFEMESMWLGEEDIERDDGTPVPIEQPTQIKTPPLSEKDQDDRVRMALGLTHDDPLPEISLQTLLTYHSYLKANLKFPFNAYCGEEDVGPFSRKRATMTMTGLLDPMRDELGVEDGLVCRGRRRGEEVEVQLAEIEVGKKNPNHKLISDYAYWFHNWPCRDESAIDREDDGQDVGSEFRPPGMLIFAKTILLCVVGGAILGATIGAVLKTFNGARLTAMIGGTPLGMIGALVLGRYGIIAGAVNRLRFGAFFGAVLGSVGGGLVGVIAGLTVLAVPWSLLGLITGMFLGPYLLPQKQRRLVSFRAAFFGTCIGLLISAFRHDQVLATAGAVPGAITGLVSATVLFLLFIGAVYLIPRTPMEYDDVDELSRKVKMAKTPDRAILSHLVDAHDRILEDSLGLGDPEFHEIEDQLYEAIVGSPYRAVIKNRNIYIPDFNGPPGEVIVVDPAEPEDVDDPNVLNLDQD